MIIWWDGGKRGTAAQELRRSKEDGNRMEGIFGRIL